MSQVKAEMTKRELASVSPLPLVLGYVGVGSQAGVHRDSTGGIDVSTE